MTGYRFLPPAEEEMTEASLFYERASSGLGDDFLDDIERVISDVCVHPAAGHRVGHDLRRVASSFPIQFDLPPRIFRHSHHRRVSSKAASTLLAFPNRLDSQATAAFTEGPCG
jgi:hypothetical protein